jgi:hypothetical protein
MAQDLRELFKEDKQKMQKPTMPNGHQKRFEILLDQCLPIEEENKPNAYFFWMKIAAVFVVVIGVLSLFMLNNPEEIGNQNVVDTPNKVENNTTEKDIYLSDISPEYKQIEDYYLANINTELSQLNITIENKELIDSFMLQLEQLDKEYKRLNSEIKETGIDEQTVSSLINNLELRLDMLFKLKNKLNEIKQESLQEIQGNKI